MDAFDKLYILEESKVQEVALSDISSNSQKDESIDQQATGNPFEQLQAKTLTSHEDAEVLVTAEKRISMIVKMHTEEDLQQQIPLETASKESVHHNKSYSKRDNSDLEPEREGGKI